MRLTLQPNDNPAYGQGASYVVALRADERAVLEAVDEGSWRLIIHRLGTVVDRGLFGSTHDILTLLEAELFPMPSVAISGQTLSGAASGDTRHPQTGAQKTKEALSRSSKSAFGC